MQVHEARVLLGFPPNSSPTPSQIKAAYKKKVWESHPDLFPLQQKASAECRFKSISEAYAFLLSGARRGSTPATYSQVVRTGMPRAPRGRSGHIVIGIPFLLIVLGTVGLGVLNASRAYKKQKETYPPQNPFLP